MPTAYANVKKPANPFIRQLPGAPRRPFFIGKKLLKIDNEIRLEEIDMREVICRRYCSYYKPQKNEAEKCLAFELLNAWATHAPEMRAALVRGPETVLEAGSLPIESGCNDNSGASGNQDRDLGKEISLKTIEKIICSHCVFRSHGCDFANKVPGEAPCGGVRVLGLLLVEGKVSEKDLTEAWDRFLSAAYLRPAEHVSLRYLEMPHLYDRQADELYEINEPGFTWLTRCNGATPGLAGQADREFLEVLLGESLLACGASPFPRNLSWKKSPVPSLRYLELLLTERCNLRCRHCYLGEAGERELPFEAVLQTLEEFQNMQGLRVLLSGGEPLLYSRWQALNERLPEFELRLVLLSNGLLLTDEVIGELNVDEVQLSLDGMETGHELIRGTGTWKKTVRRIKALQNAGLEVAIATMIHRGNLDELEKMRNWLHKLGIREWNLDIPCSSGRLNRNQDLWLNPEEAGRYLELGFGGSDHGSSGNFACGRHLAAVLANGKVAKCGLFGDEPLGSLDEGLEICWLRLQHRRLSELDCASCVHISECRGGCRFRAGRSLAPDPVMCARYGIDPNIFRR
jgi:radical SAM protein with 4Fe4S-binding SPASM domain